MNGVHLRYMNDVNMSRTDQATRRRGAPPAGQRLSRKIVVEQAFALIETDGLSSFSIRRLAAVLGVQPAALYNHVKDRNELLDAVANRFIEQFEPIRPDLPWQEAVRWAALSGREHLLANPNMADLLLARPAAVPATRTYMQDFTEVLEQSGLDPATAHSTMHAVLTALLGNALQERAWGVDRSHEFEFLINLILRGLETRENS